MQAPTAEWNDVEFTSRLIRAKAHRLRRRAGLRPDEVEDVVQDLWVDLAARRRAFDPSRGCWAAFAATVVRHRAGVLAARIQRDRARRSRGTPTWRTGVDPALEAFQLREDVRTVLQRLSPADRALCEHLQRDNVSTIARELGVPRQTLADRVHRLRSRFRGCGLGEIADGRPRRGTSRE